MAITGALTLLVAGRIMKMVDTRIIITLCITFIALLYIAQSFFTAVWQFYISFGLIGILYVIPIGLAPTVLLANWFDKQLGLVMGIALGISGFGGMVFNPIISSFITNLGWKTSYQLTGLILVICILPFSIFVFKFRPDPAKGELPYGYSSEQQTAKEQDKQDDQGLTAKQAYHTPTFFLLALVSVILQIVAGIVQHISSHEVSQGLSLAQGALVVSGIMLGAALGKISIGILLDHLNPNLIIIAYSVIGLTGWGLIAQTASATLAIFAGVLAGIGQGVLLVALPWVIRKSFGSKDYSEILSIISMFGSVASAIAVTAHGAVFDITGSYIPSLTANVIFYIIAALSMVIAYIRRPFKIAQ